MKIALLGAGNIGATLVARFVAAGYDVRLSNSRGPDSIRELAVAVGASATTGPDAVGDADVVVTSIPFARIPELRSVLAQAPERAVVIDTSNYYTHRDDRVPSVEASQFKRLWVSEQLW